MARKKLSLITGGKQNKTKPPYFFNYFKKSVQISLICPFASFQGHNFLSVPRWLIKRNLWACSSILHYFICRRIVWEYTCVLLWVCREVRVDGKMPGSTALFPNKVCFTMTLGLKNSYSFFNIRSSPRQCSCTESQHALWEIQWHFLPPMVSFQL